MTDDVLSEPAEATPAELCALCRKPAALCLCATLTPVANRKTLVILQHPQEQDLELGTARLATLCLTNAKLRIGLSWPNLAKALGRPADPKRWAVLYLGPAKISVEAQQQRVMVLDRKGEAVPAANAVAALAELDGVILLDGSWSQAKTLWWRNPWLLKCPRVALNPPWPSRYGKLRREPRRDSVSTIEAAALILGHLESSPEIERTLLKAFETLLSRFRDMQRGQRAALRPPASPPKPVEAD